MWLNPGPATFFLVLSVYLFLKGHYVESSIALAVSTGFKQTSVLVFPILIIAVWKIRGFSKDLAYFVLAYCGLLFMISLPYIYQNPQQYSVGTAASDSRESSRGRQWISHRVSV